MVKLLFILPITAKMRIDNRRKYQRIHFEGQAELKFVSCSYALCRVKNLSLTGMYVEGKFHKHKKAKFCDVEVFHGDKAGNNSLRASAEVVWKNDKGFGLKFTTMTFENYLLLQTTLIDNAEEAATILRELPANSPFLISNL